MGARHPIELDSAIPDLARRYFELGWDYAAHASPLPETAPTEMRQGWQEGHRRIKSRPASKFDRKWLLLRFNALRRNRLVDASVTPLLLERITPRMCPVLAQRLTFGTGDDLDWSVDRIFNGGGYAEANVAIMSVRANNAKGSKGIKEVAEIAARLLKEGGTEHGLTGREWTRLAALMVGPHVVATGELVRYPQCTLLPPGLVATAPQVFQDAILYDTAMGGPTRVVGRLRAMCDRSGARRLHRLVQAIKHKVGRNRWVYDVWIEPGVFERFRDWMDGVPTDRLRTMHHTILERDKVWRGVFDDATAQETWGLETGGYVT